jgi:quercetin dioxygenase-like cupin family protein
LIERQVVCADLSRSIDDLHRDGFRLEVIYPADEPHTALLSKGRESVRLTSRPDLPPLGEDLEPFVAEFAVTRSGASPGHGRAGMLYRDLIPGRLGGRYIASHIFIPQGGPVGDWVHFHRLVLQMIYVRRGWVRVVYEDQGEPFVMHEGDLVLQPPEIRHRVLESSPGLEVIEISAPALHPTFAEHQLQLPNGYNPHRQFGRQRFLHHIAARSGWASVAGAEVQETQVSSASSGLADVRTMRRGEGSSIEFDPHRGELVFGFVLSGEARLEFGGEHHLRAADSFVIPPDESWSLSTMGPDFSLLHVATSMLD